MTTIVYHDGILAADRLVTNNEVSVGHLRKILEVCDTEGELLGWVAVSGLPSDGIDAARWLSTWPKTGSLSSKAPKRFQDGATSGIFLVKSGGVWILGGSEPFQVEAEFHAFGSGFEIALGALAMGASAIRAVEIASVYDQGTGGGVDSVRALC